MNLIIRSVCLLGLIGLFASCSPEPVTVIEETANLETNATVIHDQQFADAVLDVINDHRIAMGLDALEQHSLSRSKAVEHTIYMVTQNRMSHDRFFQRSDYLKSNGAEVVSENVAYGQRSPEAVVAAWLDSPSHKAAIEGDYTHTGIGVAANSHGINYYTQIFIK